MHRITTLGHVIVATKIPWGQIPTGLWSFLTGRESDYNADTYVAKNKVEIIRDWQTYYEVKVTNIVPYLD